MGPGQKSRPASAGRLRPSSARTTSSPCSDGVDPSILSSLRNRSALEWVSSSSGNGKLKNQRAAVVSEGGLLQQRAQEALRRWEKAASAVKKEKASLGPSDAVTGGKINLQKAGPITGHIRRNSEKENKSNSAGAGLSEASRSTKLQQLDNEIASIEQSGSRRFLAKEQEPSGAAGKTAAVSQEKSSPHVGTSTKKSTATVVTIHVYDDARRISRDFTCELDVLLAEMKYFTKHLGAIGEGQQVEITVHCDVAVFGWLLRYAKQEDRPAVSLGTCLPVLISSDFLNMHRLVQECVHYVAQHIREIAAMPLDLCCLSPSLLQHLALELIEDDLEDLYLGWCPAPADSAGDRAGKKGFKGEDGCEIMSRPALACKLYKLRLEKLLHASEKNAKQTEGERAPISRCVNCRNIFATDAPQALVCPKARLFIDFHGQAFARHVAVQQWDLYCYLNNMRQKGHNWRGLYWHVWGSLQTLECKDCGNFFSAANTRTCMYHPAAPLFMPGESRGAYPCCKQPALKFMPMQGLHKQGCCTRLHSVEVTTLTNSPSAILQKHAAVIEAPFAQQQPASQDLPDADDTLSHPLGGAKVKGGLFCEEEEDEWEEPDRPTVSWKDNTPWQHTSLREASIPENVSPKRPWPSFGSKSSSCRGGSFWKARKGARVPGGSLFKADWEDCGQHSRQQRAFVQGLRRDDDVRRMQALAAELISCREKKGPSRSETAEKGLSSSSNHALPDSNRKGSKPLSAQAKGLLLAYSSARAGSAKRTRPSSAPRPAFVT